LPNRPVHLLALLAEPDQTPSAAATPPLRFYLYRLPRSLDTYYLSTALDVRGYLVFFLLLIKSNCRSRVSNPVFNPERVAGYKSKAEFPSSSRAMSSFCALAMDCEIILFTN